ncbi:hypothetical protein AVEN_147112-1 [Araneus ventricosus]|uniref:Uncharacterized protein n=1 Tax=Araneus ventricosus TaxID=182803 RepID=A0A4Y2JH31_ARAVE|nr:hypothetical protein AVEN_147112-1 [Araneus ventricosus]
MTAVIPSAADCMRHGDLEKRVKFLIVLGGLRKAFCRINLNPSLTEQPNVRVCSHCVGGSANGSQRGPSSNANGKRLEQLRRFCGPV